MSLDKKFNPESVDKLRNPERLERENPEVIWENLPAENLETLVDVGCGIGFTAIPFARKMRDGTVYACDANSEMLDMLKAELEKAGVKNVKPLLMEEVEIPLPDGMADVVFMQNLYHELDQPMDNLNECKRLLKSGGVMAVIDWKALEMPFGPPTDIRVESIKIETALIETGFNFVKNLDVFSCHSFVVAVKP